MVIVVWQNCAQNVFSWHGKSCGIMLADRRRMLCWILNLIWAQILKIFWFRPQKYCVLHLHQNSKSSTSLVSPKKPSIHNMLKLCRGNKPCCASCKSDLSRNNQHQLWRNLLLRISLEYQPYFLLENQPYFCMKTNRIFCMKNQLDFLLENQPYICLKTNRTICLKMNHIFAWKPTIFFARKPTTFFALKPTI